MPGAPLGAGFQGSGLVKDDDTSHRLHRARTLEGVRGCASGWGRTASLRRHRERRETQSTARRTGSSHQRRTALGGKRGETISPGLPQVVRPRCEGLSCDEELSASPAVLGVSKDELYDTRPPCSRKRLPGELRSPNAAPIARLERYRQAARACAWARSFISCAIANAVWAMTSSREADSPSVATWSLIAPTVSPFASLTGAPIPGTRGVRVASSWRASE